MANSRSGKLKIAVIGAGAIGLSAALHITERFGDLVQVHLIADKFTPETTSDKTGMLLMPFDLNEISGKEAEGNEYNEKVKRWTRDTFTKFHSLYRSALNADIQICLRYGYLTLYEPTPDPWWIDLVFGFNRIDKKSEQAIAANIPPGCVDVWAFGTYIANCSNYLAWMMKEFQAKGGKVVKRKVKSLDEHELSNFDIVINCTGMWAGDLVEEHDMKPCRGQTVVVKAPWISAFIVDEKGLDLAYVFPRGKTVVLGGTAQMGDYNEEQNPEDAQMILEKCIKLMPSLAKAEIVGGYAGLRPLRSHVRLDSEEGPTGRLTIHCYGHGGQGVVLSWGCAKDIADIVLKWIKQKAHL